MQLLPCPLQAASLRLTWPDSSTSSSMCSLSTSMRSPSRLAPMSAATGSLARAVAGLTPAAKAASTPAP